MYVTRQIQNKLQKKKINVHQRSILRQMMSTCDKLGNSFLTKCESKKFEVRQKEERQMSRKTSIIEKQHNYKRLSHDPFRCTKDNIMEDFVYVKQSKEIKQIKDLKEKMLPQVNKTNIQKKLKQLTYIRNMGFKTKNKRLQSFKTLTREQDDQNIINKSWQSFYQDRLYYSPTQTPQQQQKISRQNFRKTTKKSTYFIQKLKLTDSMTLKKPDQNNHTFNSASTPNLYVEICPNSCQASSNSWANSTFDLKSQSLNISLKTQQPRAIRVSSRNKTIFKQVMSKIPKNKPSQFSTPQTTKRYPLSTDRKKQITQKIGLTKIKLQKQNAFQLYSLIKGGYELDQHDVQGEYISLKRFRESKQNFMMLNTCFNKIKEYRYIVHEPQKVFNDGSLKSLVYLSQIQNKISPSAFRKIQQLNKVVS